MHNKKLSAFSLIESAIVLAVVGLIIGGIWAAAADLNYKRNYELFMQGFITQKRLVDQYLNQSIPCTSTMDGGTSGSYVIYNYPKLYADLVPPEWKEIDGTKKFCTHSCRITHFACDENNTRYYIVAVIAGSAKCSQLASALEGRIKAATVKRGCAYSPYFINVIYDIPRN